MKIQDLLNERSMGNTTVHGVLTTIRDIYTNERPHTSTKLCHAHTAKNIDPNYPNDKIVLFGYGDTVVHSALVRDDAIVDRYEGVSSSQLLPSGRLQINIRGNEDELEPVFSIKVSEFLANVQR